MCEGHLVDAGFATPVVDDDVAAAKTKLATLEAQITPLAASIESRKKAAKGYFASFSLKKKPDDKEKDREAALLEKDETLLEKLQEAREKEKAVAEREPRTFNLAKQFYSMRIMKGRNAAMAKQTMQKLSQPDLFPKIPTHVPGATVPGDLPGPAPDSPDPPANP